MNQPVELIAEQPAYTYPTEEEAQAWALGYREGRDYTTRALCATAQEKADEKFDEEVLRGIVPDHTGIGHDRPKLMTRVALAWCSLRGRHAFAKDREYKNFWSCRCGSTYYSARGSSPSSPTRTGV